MIRKIEEINVVTSETFSFDTSLGHVLHRGYKRLVRVTLCHGEKIPNVSKKFYNLTLLYRVSYEKSRR